jgi:hypothetical protein
VGDVTRLSQCYRCRRIFPARPGERYCPECRRAQQRERNRRRLLGGGSGRAATGAWAPLGILAVLVLAGSVASTIVPGRLGGAAPLLGGLVGVWLVWHRVAGGG